MGMTHLNDVFITQRLNNKLSQISRHLITTVIAPMGYGKTTAVKWWSMRRTKAHKSALFLRQMVLTDSVSDFWLGFCRLFGDCPELYDQLSRLPFPSDVRTLSLCSEILSKGLSDYKKDVYYIIDDIHLLPSKAIRQLILFFSKYLPNNIHIILLSRNQFFSEKERMKLGHLLEEITAYDLGLNRDELADYAAQCGVQASDQELDELATTSEGWFSIIYLNFKYYVRNRKWLSGSSDIFSLIKQVLLDPLSQEERDFLVLLGISDVFTREQAAYLWNALGSGGESEDLLNTLTKNNAFITKTNHLYRCHHMLQQCTHYYFSKKPPEYQQSIYTCLGNWYMDQEDYLSAYYAYSKADNFEKILSCIEKDRGFNLNYEHREDFFSWISRCPEDIMIQFPSAITICMLTMFTFNNIEELYRLKALLLKSLEMNTSLSDEEKNNLLGDAEISESFTVFNDISAMSQYHRRACNLLTRPTYSVDPNDLWTFGSPSVFMLYHRLVGFADSERAEMKDCMPYYYRVAQGHGSGSEHLFEAELLYERGQLIDADIVNKKAMAAAKKNNQFSIMVASEFLRTRLDFVKGKYDQVEKHIKSIRGLLWKSNQFALLNTMDICQMFIASIFGHPENSPKWLLEGRLSETLVVFPALPMLHTYYNQFLLANEDYTALIARKEECLNLYGVFNNVLCSIWLHIQLAAALRKIGNYKEALDELKTALSLAIPDHIIMPFAESASYISKELEILMKESEYASYIDKIFDLAEQVSKGRESIVNKHFKVQRDYGLSERELEIAHLAANRMTTAEIAKELYLSEGTVRNNLSRIYVKMDISGSGKNKRLQLEKRFSEQ